MCPQSTKPRQPDEAMDPPGDAVLGQFCGYHVKRGSDAIQAELAKALKPLDLRILTYSTLALIVSNPRLRQSELADLMGMESPNLVPLLNTLESRGLIRRNRDGRDRRAYALQATKNGIALYEEATVVVTEAENRVFSVLTEEQITMITQGMTLIRNALEDRAS